MKRTFSEPLSFFIISFCTTEPALDSNRRDFDCNQRPRKCVIAVGKRKVRRGGRIFLFFLYLKKPTLDEKSGAEVSETNGRSSYLCVLWAMLCFLDWMKRSILSFSRVVEWPSNCFSRDRLGGFLRTSASKEYSVEDSETIDSRFPLVVCMVFHHQSSI